MKNSTAAVFGLGSMGLGIAVSLVRAGIDTIGFDPQASRLKLFCEAGGKSVDTNTALDGIDTAVIAVLNAEQTESVLFGAEGISTKLKPGAVVLACATVSPDFAKNMARRCGEMGLHYLDAPISGGSVKAQAGELTIMASGTEAAFSLAQQALEAIAVKVFRLGDEAGAGSAIKAVNQMLAGVHIAAMAEAMIFGLSQGVSTETFLEVIPQCAGTSWMLENRAPHIVTGDYTPKSSVNIWPKDLGIVLSMAEQRNYPAPITRAALAQYLAAVDAGYGEEDDAAVAKVYASVAEVELPS